MFYANQSRFLPTNAAPSSKIATMPVPTRLLHPLFWAGAGSVVGASVVGSSVVGGCVVWVVASEVAALIVK